MRMNLQITQSQHEQFEWSPYAARGFACVCRNTGTCRSDSVSLKSYLEQIFPTPPTPLLGCCFKLGEMICCFLLDETGWHGILNSPAQIERNKHRSELVTATDNHQDVETTPAQTQHCLQISIFRYVWCVCVSVYTLRRLQLPTNLAQPRRSYWQGPSSTDSGVSR